MRNENCNLIDIGIAHYESASDITDRGARRHGSESDYERGMVIPVFAADVINGFVAFVIRKVNVEVGHADTFRIQKALEYKPVNNRVDIDYTAQVCHKTAGSASSSWTDGYSVGFRVIDKIPHDKIIFAVAHTVYDRKLVVDSLAVFVFGMGVGIDDMLFTHSRFKSVESKAAQEIRRCRSVLRFVSRKKSFAENKIKIAHLGNLHGVFDRTLILRKKRSHLIGRLIIEFVGFKSDRSSVGYARVRLYAEKHRLNLGIAFSYIVDVICGNHRNPGLI